MKKLLRILFHRVFIVALLMLLQIVSLILMLLLFEEYFIYFYGISLILSFFLVVHIISTRINPAYKIAWIIPILLVPIFGMLAYFIFGTTKISRKEQRRLMLISKELYRSTPTNYTPIEKLRNIDQNAAIQASYIHNIAHWPVYNNTSTEYLPMGEVKFQRLQEELKKAKHYIFLEYFIIAPGVMWNTILEILEQKVQEGLDVRVMFDDLGSSFTLPFDYPQTLKDKGIQCAKFSPFLPVLSARFNNRDHQKICAIDGHTAFTGGINLSDEYINAKEKHGHWKDTAILIKGHGAFSLTQMFLSVWNFTTKSSDKMTPFYPKPENYPFTTEPNGYVQPFNDSPLDSETVGESVYMNLINKARRYVWIYTPYLIITSEMERALILAAKSGIDVRIVTPHVPDKWYVHTVTKDYYEPLIEAGVKIFEYTPGFIHGKTFLVDDEYGVVGTINLDFRSLYLHFECGVWMYKTNCLKAMKEDYLSTLTFCQQISLEQCQKISLPRKLLQHLLRLFAPLL